MKIFSQRLNIHIKDSVSTFVKCCDGALNLIFKQSEIIIKKLDVEMQLPRLVRR